MSLVSMQFFTFIVVALIGYYLIPRGFNGYGFYYLVMYIIFHME